MLVLGLSAFYHDSAAALVADGEVLAAVEEERLSRVKNDAGFPGRAIRACLDWAGADLADVDVVAFYEKPHRKLARVLSCAVRTYPGSRAHFDAVLRRWAERDCWTPAELRTELGHLAPGSTGRRGGRWDGPLRFVPHHLSHAASAFHPSPFERAAVLVVDGVGEFGTTTIARGWTEADGRRRIRLLRELRFPHSVGLVYSAFTQFLGFRVNEDEYKVMGLAPYGVPRFADAIRAHVLRPAPDGAYAVDTQVLTYHRDDAMYDVARMERLFGPARRRDEPLTERHADLAASVQAVTEEVQLGLARTAFLATGEPGLVIAGGVALNCVANGRILREGPFADVWVPPAPGDAGGAVGAALQVWHSRPRSRAPMRVAVRNPAQVAGARLGPAHGRGEIDRALAGAGLPHVELPPAELAARIAELLAGGAIIGWFQGRMEFGPRALGGRSILADPRPASVQRTLNLRVKRRESFRPFAPVVLRERVHEWFELAGREGSLLGAPGAGYDSPYMSLVAVVRPDRVLAGRPDGRRRFGGLDQARTQISAATHVDDSARIQTVGPGDDPLLYAVLTEFDQLTGVPVLVNTSFNRSGEPIVCSPRDAVTCFLDTDLDYLCLGSALAWKSGGTAVQRTTTRTESACQSSPRPSTSTT